MPLVGFHNGSPDDDNEGDKQKRCHRRHLERRRVAQGYFSATILEHMAFGGFALSPCYRGTAANPGRSDWYRHVFGIERRFEKARGNRGLSSPKPLIVVRREV